MALFLPLGICTMDSYLMNAFIKCYLDATTLLLQCLYILDIYLASLMRTESCSQSYRLFDSLHQYSLTNLFSLSQQKQKKMHIRTSLRPSSAKRILKELSRNSVMLDLNYNIYCDNECEFFRIDRVFLIKYQLR